MRHGRIFLAVAAFLFTLGRSPLAASAAGTQAPRIDCWVGILPQAFVLKSIGGERVHVRVMVGPGQVPHTYEPTARQLSELASARLYFSVGVAFEEALLPRVRRNFPTVQVVDMTAGIPRRSASDNDTGERGREERTPTTTIEAPQDPHGHGGLDPHVWLSPRLAVVMARNARDALVAADPAGEAIYEENFRVLEAALGAVDAEIAGLLRPYQGREIFVFHPAYGYFTDAYGLVQIAIEENGAAPGPKHLAEVIDRAREEGASAIFVQSQVSSSYAQTVAQAIGARVVTLDPLSEDYVENLKTIAREIASSLEGTGTR